jgi:hypothetical protein
MFCPYCDCRAPAAAFTTENQRAFLNRQRELWITAFQGGENEAEKMEAWRSEAKGKGYTTEEEETEFATAKKQTLEKVFQKGTGQKIVWQ